MIKQETLEAAIKKASQVLTGFELEFFSRIWNGDLEKFRARLKALGFENQDRVLDAGFGNAQWTICLAEMNKFVDGIEYTESRVKVGKILESELEIKNTNLIQGSVEELPYEDNSFDAVFCYGVIFLTDFKKSVAELYRVLKPGGKLYFTANGLGWYLMCTIEEHNKSQNYDPRQMASETIAHSFNYFGSNADFERGKQLFVTRPIITKLLQELKFEKIEIKSEGTINVSGNEKSLSFYKHEKYLDSDFIYDILCYK